MTEASRVRSIARTILRRAARPLRPVRRAIAPWNSTRKLRRRFADSPPDSLNEKILYKMAFDRRPVLKVLADKVAVRDYVADRVGTRVLTEIYATHESLTDLRIEALPERFVIKPSHGSGAIIIVSPDADEKATFPELDHNTYWPYGFFKVRAERLGDANFFALAKRWLSADYSKAHGGWCYSGLTPRLIIEELLEGPEGDIPLDYKFWCFEGQIGFVGVDLARFSENTRSLHLPDWRSIDATITYPAPDRPPAVPERFGEMLAIASSIARGLDFVRVDLYETPERVVFGEMTNYPGGGGLAMVPESLLSALGSRWRPERHYGSTSKDKIGR